MQDIVLGRMTPDSRHVWLSFLRVGRVQTDFPSPDSAVSRNAECSVLQNLAYQPRTLRRAPGTPELSSSINRVLFLNYRHPCREAAQRAAGAQGCGWGLGHPELVRGTKLTAGETLRFLPTQPFQGSMAL